MALNPEISLGVRPPVIQPLQIQDPLQQYAKVQTLRNLMQDQQVQQLKLQEAERGIADERSLRDLVTKNPNATAAEVIGAGGTVRGTAWLKSQQEAEKAKLDRQTQANTLNVSNAKRRAQIAAGVTDLEGAKKAAWQAASEGVYDIDPAKNAQMARDVLEHLQANGFNPDEWKQHAMESLDYAARQELADKVAEEERKKAKAPFELRTATAGATKAEQEAAGTQPFRPVPGRDVPLPEAVQKQKVEEAAARANILQTPEKIAQDLQIKQRELALQSDNNINKAMSGDGAKVFSIASSIQPGLAQLREAFTKDYNGTLRGILLGTNPDLAKLASNVADQVGRLRSGGAVNPSEEKRFKDQIASRSDLLFGNADATLAALDRYIAEAKKVADGLKPSEAKKTPGATTPAPSGTSKVKVWNEKTGRFEER